MLDLMRFIAISDAGWGYRNVQAGRFAAHATEEETERKGRAEIQKVIARLNPLLVDWAKKEKLAVVFEKRSGVAFHDRDLDLAEDLKLPVDKDRPESFKPRGEGRRDFSLRIAVVDLGRVLHTSKAGKAKKAELQADLAKRQAKLDAEAAKLKALHERGEKLEKGSPELEELKKEIIRQMQSLNALKEGGDYELKFFEKVAIEDVLEKLAPFLAAVARRNGYSVVLDRDGAGVVYADAGLDLTDELVRLFDAGGDPQQVQPGKPKPLTRLRFVDLDRVGAAHAKATGANLDDEQAAQAFFSEVTQRAAAIAKRDGVGLVLAPHSAPVVHVRTDLDLSAELIERIEAARKKR